MSVSTRDGRAPARPDVPTESRRRSPRPAPPASVMPVVPGLVALASGDAPMCADEICL